MDAATRIRRLAHDSRSLRDLPAGEQASLVQSLVAVHLGAQPDHQTDPLDDGLDDLGASRGSVTGRPVTQEERREAAAARRAASELRRLYEWQALHGDADSEPPAMPVATAALTEALASIMRPVKLEDARLCRARLKARRAAAVAARHLEWADAPFAAARAARTSHVPAPPITRAQQAELPRAKARVEKARSAVQAAEQVLADYRARAERVRETLLPIVTAVLAGEMMLWRYVRGWLVDMKGRNYPLGTIT